MEVKVSSITYVKNCHHYIEKCVRSVMNQTLKEIEIIVVDGWSNDGTYEILERLASEDNRIKLLREDGGVGRQFNKALLVAKGKYVGICEGDDCIHHEKYEKLYRYANDNDLDVIRSNYGLWYEIEEEDRVYKIDIVPEGFEYGEIINKSENKNLFLATFVNGYWNGLYKRDFLATHDITKNETPGASFQDITFSFLTQLYAERYSFFDEVLHYYRIDNPGASVNSDGVIKKLMTEYTLLKEQLFKRNLWEEYKQMLYYWELLSFKQFMDRDFSDDKEGIIRSIYIYLENEHVNIESPKISIPKDFLRIYEAYHNGVERFVSVLCENDENLKKLIAFFNSEIEEYSSVVVFGAGHFGHIINDYLRLMGIKVTFVDNSEKLQEYGVDGETVYPVNEKTILNDKPIIIANVRHSRDMYDQVKKIRGKMDKVIVCDYEDLFLRDIFMKYLYEKKVGCV